MKRRVLLSLGYLLAACDEHKTNGARPGVTEPSPNASILPAPLASGIEATNVGAIAKDDLDRRDGGHLLDAGADAAPPEPHALREDQALSSDTTRETNGLTLTARLRWLDTSAVPRAAEQNADAMQRAREGTAFDVAIDLAGNRMKWVFASRAFTVAAGSELHARDDSYGHVLLWPNRATYTVLPPGTLRSVLSQQRADVVPLVRARASALPGGSQFALGTERVELSTPIGRLELEQARAPRPAQPNPVWASGMSLCRLLVELVGALPNSPSCSPDLLPVRAEYSWPNGGRFGFEVSRLQRRTDLDPTALAMPEPGAEFRQSELPPPPPVALLSDAELADFRFRPAARGERPEPNAPKSGLLVLNHSEGLRYLTVDGVPVARLPPGAEQLLLGLRPGKYQAAYRDFFGSDDPVQKTLEVPARFAVGDDFDKSH